MTLHRKKPKMARAWWRACHRSPFCARTWFACYRWHKAVKP